MGWPDFALHVPPSPQCGGPLGLCAERTGCPPDHRPPRPWLGMAGARQPVVFSLHALHGWGCHPTLADLFRPAGTHRQCQALPHGRAAVAGSTPGRRGAGQSPFHFLFLPILLLAAGRRLPRGDMKEKETRCPPALTHSSRMGSTLLLRGPGHVQAQHPASLWWLGVWREELE